MRISPKMICCFLLLCSGITLLFIFPESKIYKVLAIIIIACFGFLLGKGRCANIGFLFPNYRQVEIIAKTGENEGIVSYKGKKKFISSKTFPSEIGKNFVVKNNDLWSRAAFWW